MIRSLSGFHINKLTTTYRRHHLEHVSCSWWSDANGRTVNSAIRAMRPARTVDGGQREYKVHLGTQTGMLLKLYNIDCDVIRTGCWNTNKQPFFFFIFQIQLLVQLYFNFVVCFYTHPSFNIQFMWVKLYVQKGFYRAVFTLCIYVYIYSSYPSFKPSCAIISAETAQYKGEVFIGAILHLLEATDS